MTVAGRSQPSGATATSTARHSGSTKQVPITLNVYNLNTACIKAFHSGIQCGEREYSFFHGTGINHHRPKRAPVGVYKESILLGYTDNWRVFDSAINQLRVDFQRSDYDFVYRNCNDFTNAVCERLFNRGIPAQINRLARIGRMRGIACCLPLFFGLKPRKPTHPLGTAPPVTTTSVRTSAVHKNAPQTHASHAGARRDKSVSSKTVHNSAHTVDSIPL